MKSMKKFRLEKEGVSEVIGTVLLLAIAITAFSVLAVYVFSNTGNNPSPHVNLVGYMDENYNAVIEHAGGDSLKLENVRIVVWKGEVNSSEFIFTKSILHNYNHTIPFQSKGMFYDENNNRRWDVGDYIRIDCPSIFGDVTHWQISVVVIDKESNSIIMSGILQEGIVRTVPPVAIFTYAPWDPKTKETVIFNASQSYDPDGGSIVIYKWDFGDGNIGYGKIVVHKYTNPGNYTVTLTVTDDEGQSSTAVSGTGYTVPPPVRVTENIPPQGNFTWEIDISVDGKIDFISDAFDPDGEIISYFWNFGDGSTSSSPNPSHIYDMSGNYTVTLIITDDNGATSTVEKTITVPNKKPIPVITYSPSSPNTKQYVFFDASSSFDVDGYITNYSWDFENDGIIDAYGTNVNHMFSTAGNYTVNLTVTDNQGKTNYTTKVIQVIVSVTTPNFIIVDNTPAPPRNWDGISRIVAAVQKLTSDYSTGKAIDSWYFVGGTEQGKRIEDTFLDEFDIVIWSTGNFSGDGAPAINDGKSNTWSTSMTEGYDDTSNHVYEIYQHLTHNGTLLLTGSYAVRDLQDYWGNGANSDEIWLGNTLGLVEPTGGIDESLHSGETGHFATDYYPNSGAFGYGPVYANGTISGIPGTSSGGADIVITQDIPLYSLIKQGDTLYQYSLQVSGGTFYEDFEDGLTGWTTSYYAGSYPWRVSDLYRHSPPSGGGSWIYHPDPFYGYYHNPSGPYATGHYAYGYDGDWLISPQITVPTGGKLEFYAGSYWRWSQASFNVKLSTTGNTPNDFNILLGSQYNIPRIREHGWTKYTYDLSQYAGQKVYIAIEDISGLLFVDNFKVASSGIPPGYYAIDAVRGANRSIVLGFDLNSPYITNESREQYIRNAVAWMAEGLGYVTKVYVDDDAPPEWYDETHLHTIQEGIDAVTLGGTVYVYEGTYSPTVVNKSVNIIGINNPVIDAPGAEYGFNLTVDWVTIDGFVIEGENTQNGILFSKSSSNTIKNCTIYGCDKGLNLVRAHHNTIEDNNIYSCNHGAYLYYSLDNTISNNNLSNNVYGLYAEHAFLCKIQNNEIKNCNQDGIYIYSSENNTFWNNDIENNGGNGIYLLSSTNGNVALENTIVNNTNGVYLEISTNNIVAGNALINNDEAGVRLVSYSSKTTIVSNEINNSNIGIFLENSSSNEISGNAVYENFYGIKMYVSGGNNITFNTIHDNIHDAITSVQSSNNNNISNNIIYNNSRGIYLNDVRENVIWQNEIYSNNESAVYLFNSLSGGYGNNKIVRNNITDSKFGIYLERSSNNLISFNNLSSITDKAIFITAYSNEVDIVSNNIEESGYGIYIERSNYNTLSNNSINHVSGDGIVISLYSSENMITNNTVTDSKNGIYLDYTSINTLINNTLFENNENGILVYSSNLNIIENNKIFLNDDDGILLTQSDENNLEENLIYNNTNGIHVLYSGGSGNKILSNEIYGNTQHGIFLENSRKAAAGNNEITGNEIYNNGKSGIYLYISNTNSINQNDIYNNENGIFTNSSDDNTINSNTIYHNNKNGIFLVSSDGNRISNNSISFNQIGFNFYRSSEGDQYKIGGNRIWNNTYGILLNASDANYFGYNIVNEIWNNTYGVYMAFSSNNHFTHNIIFNNEFGVYMTTSSASNELQENNISFNNYSVFIAAGDCLSNTIWNNNFINNSIHNNSQAWDMGNNSWYVSTTGNYWSDYNGTDGDGNGRGDTPYVIPPALNRDLYPLITEVKWW